MEEREKILELFNGRKEQTVEHYNKNTEFYGDMTKEQKLECLCFPIAAKFKASVSTVKEILQTETDVLELLT